MRIGIVCYPTYGGSGVVATELGLALARAGHDVHFVSYAPPFRLQGYQERVSFHEVSAPEYPLFNWQPYDLALASRLVDVANKADLEIVHSHYAVPHAIAAYLAREMLAQENGRTIRTVTTLHGTDITLIGADPSYLPATRFGLRQSNAITAVSTWLARETARVCGECAESIHVIPNFVDPDRFNPRHRSEALRRRFAPHGEGIALHVSNLRPVKRIADVVRAFARVRKSLPAVLLIVGEGPDLPRARELARQEGIESSVHFLGNQDGVEVLQASADVLLLPSAFESFGLAALEAMACGTPVVATASGGLPEVVEHGASGFLTEVGDIDALATATATILGDPERRRHMGEHGRAVALERFRPELILARYVAVYESVLGRG